HRERRLHLPRGRLPRGFSRLSFRSPTLFVGLRNLLSPSKACELVATVSAFLTVGFTLDSPPRISSIRFAVRCCFSIFVPRIRDSNFGLQMSLPVVALELVAHRRKPPHPLLERHKGCGTPVYTLVSLRKEVWKWYSPDVSETQQGRFGKFSAPPAGQALILLHELAHTLTLIPPDS